MADNLALAAETGDDGGVKAYATELKAIKAFELYLNNVYEEGNAAAEYIKIYEQTKEENQNVDQ